MNKHRMNFEYLRGLAEYCLKSGTFATGDNIPDRPTIKQFCDELRDDMLYHHEIDVSQDLVDKHGEDVIK